MRADLFLLQSVDFSVCLISLLLTSSKVTPSPGKLMMSCSLFHFRVASELVWRMLTGIISGCSVPAVSFKITARLIAFRGSRMYSGPVILAEEFFRCFREAPASQRVDATEFLDKAQCE